MRFSKQSHFYLCIENKMILKMFSNGPITSFLFPYTRLSHLIKYWYYHLFLFSMTFKYMLELTQAPSRKCIIFRKKIIIEIFSFELLQEVRKWFHPLSQGFISRKLNGPIVWPCYRKMKNKMSENKDIFFKVFMCLLISGLNSDY